MGVEAVIDLKECSRLRFCKSHPIPQFALCRQVKQAINKHVPDGDLELVDRNDRAVLIVTGRGHPY